MRYVPVKDFSIGKGEPLTVISGPCVIENEGHCISCAQRLSEIFSRHPKINFVFKASYDKANRTSLNSYRGPGLDEGLRILKRVKDELDVPILTDVHTVDEAYRAAEVCDILQIPALLCRQTDLIVAAARTGRAVQIKKGQFMAPWDMRHAVEKAKGSGNENIILVERGTSFGYQNLVCDMRSIPIMQSLGVPVCFDATHAVQHPGSMNGHSGGEREFAPMLAKAALAAGADCLYLESHPSPPDALSDAASMIYLETLENLLPVFQSLYESIQMKNEEPAIGS